MPFPWDHSNANRATGGFKHVLEPAYTISLAPGESAIIRNQRATDENRVCFGQRLGQNSLPWFADTQPGQHYLVQPLQIHVPPPAGGIMMLGLAYTYTRIDKEGNPEPIFADRRAAEPGGEIFFPRTEIEFADLNEEASEDQVSWGETDKGLQCGIRFLNEADEYRIGDMLEAEIFWRNVSDDTIETPLPGQLDIYPWIVSEEDRNVDIDFGGRIMLRPGSFKFPPGEVRKLGAIWVRLVEQGTPSPNSNMQPGHVVLQPGTYYLLGSGGLSGAETGSPASGKLTFKVAKQ